jgi:hypothetical protein
MRARRLRFNYLSRVSQLSVRHPNEMPSAAWYLPYLEMAGAANNAAAAEASAHSAASMLE